MFPTEGLPDPDPPAPPLAGPFVAIAVGNTKDGESFPAKPIHSLSAWQNGRASEELPRLAMAHTKLGEARAAAMLTLARCGEGLGQAGDALVHDNGRSLVGHGGEICCGEQRTRSVMEAERSSGVRRRRRMTRRRRRLWCRCAAPALKVGRQFMKVVAVGLFWPQARSIGAY